MRPRSAGLVALVALLGIGFAATIGCSSGAGAKPRPRVLVFSKTAGFRHDSIPAGIQAIQQLGQAGGFSVTATEDGGEFRAKRLRRFRAIVFLNTTGDVLDAAGQAALKRYIKSGGGYVGIHSASDTEHDWPFYGGLVGAFFQAHPAVQPARIDVVDRSHPSTQALPPVWTRTDEWYNFAANPRGRVHVLAVIEESSYQGGTMGADHPIAWCQVYRGGRSWYTAGGHTIESFSEPLFRQHLLGGIRWATGQSKGDCRP